MRVGPDDPQEAGGGPGGEVRVFLGSIGETP